MAFDRGSGGSMSQINVTPLVDVMLVLLVIFMVTAPILQQGVPVDLPQVDVGVLTGDEDQIIVSIVRAGEIFVDEDLVDPESLGAALQARAGQGASSAPIFVRADRRLSYGVVMEIMARIHDAGFRKVGLVTEAGENALELEELGSAERL